MMKIIVLFLFATLLVAANPKVYSALGDVVYDNIQNIEKLKDIESYSKDIQMIDIYIKNVNKSKDFGYSIEGGDKSVDKGEYLKGIRVLSKTNDFFHRKALSTFKLSMKNRDNEQFIQIVNTGLIDTQKYKNEIVEYYFFQCGDIKELAEDSNTSLSVDSCTVINQYTVIQDYIEEDKLLKEKNEKGLVTKKQIQEARIKSIRNKDKKKQASIQNELEKELTKIKSEIRKEQVKGLSE